MNGKLPECKTYLQKKKLKKNVIYARDESLILKKYITVHFITRVTTKHNHN